MTGAKHCLFNFTNMQQYNEALLIVFIDDAQYK